MRIHFFTAPFYFAFIWFRVQGSGFKVQGSRFRVQGSGFKVQGSGGGFAAFFYWAMPESGIQVTDYQS